jgi:CheY-like chemotaxis protein
MSVILTVEDETLVSAYLGQVLKDAGYQVIAAANADEAIEILEAKRYPNCHHRCSYAGLNGWASASGGSQGPLAANQDHHSQR